MNGSVNFFRRVYLLSAALVGSAGVSQAAIPWELNHAGLVGDYGYTVSFVGTLDYSNWETTWNGDFSFTRDIWSMDLNVTLTIVGTTAGGTPVEIELYDLDDDDDGIVPTVVKTLPAGEYNLIGTVFAKRYTNIDDVSIVLGALIVDGPESIGFGTVEDGNGDTIGSGEILMEFGDDAFYNGSVVVDEPLQYELVWEPHEDSDDSREVVESGSFEVATGTTLELTDARNGYGRYHLYTRRSVPGDGLVWGDWEVTDQSPYFQPQQITAEMDLDVDGLATAQNQETGNQSLEDISGKLDQIASNTADDGSSDPVPDPTPELQAQTATLQDIKNILDDESGDPVEGVTPEDGQWVADANSEIDAMESEPAVDPDEVKTSMIDSLSAWWTDVEAPSIATGVVPDGTTPEFTIGEFTISLEPPPFFYTAGAWVRTVITWFATLAVLYVLIAEVRVSYSMIFNS